MADTAKIAILLRQVAEGVAIHDRENPDHHTWGIGMARFDIERLGLEEGEELLPGIILQADGGQTATFRILCDGQHGSGSVQEAETVEAISREEVAEPVHAPAGLPPLRPPSGGRA